MMLPARKSAPRRRTERGYILITLILFVALIAIAAVVMVPVVAFQVKRDREEELIHRGVQYSRAMKHFVKKFGRYPTRIEELENTNQVRFLRKRYKDPINGKDFKILHMGDVQLSFGAGLAGAVPAGGLNPGGLGAPGIGGPGGPTGLPNGAVNTVAVAGGLASAINAGNPGQASAGSTFATPTPGQNSPDNADNENAASGPNQSPNPGAPVRAHRVRALPEPSGELPPRAAVLKSSAADRSLESPVQVKTKPSAYLTRKTTTMNGNSSTIRALIAVDFSPRPTSPLSKGQAVPYRRALPELRAHR